jgi:hypothetical protein
LMWNGMPSMGVMRESKYKLQDFVKEESIRNFYYSL